MKSADSPEATTGAKATCSILALGFVLLVLWWGGVFQCKERIVYVVTGEASAVQAIVWELPDGRIETEAKPILPWSKSVEVEEGDGVALLVHRRKKGQIRAGIGVDGETVAEAEDSGSLEVVQAVRDARP